MKPSRDPGPLVVVLNESSTLTLATIEPDGSPRATPVFFTATPDGELIFLSDPQTPHGENLLRQPKVAAAAYPDVGDWSQIRGVQLKGLVERLTEDRAEDALARYRARFPFLDEVPAARQSMAVFVLRPRWARLIDNRRGFGYAEEWTWA
jgi:uncharacterized protein YhbP (UPF0306 family)